MADGKTLWASSDAWLIFEDETGQDMRAPTARTWGWRGVTPQVRVCGASRGKVSVAGAVCYRRGERSRLQYRMKVTRRRPEERSSFTWQEYRDFLVALHHQLDGPMIVIWDNLNVHTTQGMKEFVAASDAWLTVVQLPAYSPDLNPTEGIWSVLKGSLGNRIATSLDDLVAAIKHRLKKLQYRAEVIDGVLRGTGLDLAVP